MSGLADFCKVCIMINRFIQPAGQFCKEESDDGIYIVSGRFCSGCHYSCSDFGGIFSGFRNCGCSRWWGRLKNRKGFIEKLLLSGSFGRQERFRGRVEFHEVRFYPVFWSFFFLFQSSYGKMFKDIIKPTMIGYKYCSSVKSWIIAAERWYVKWLRNGSSVKYSGRMRSIL